MPETELKPCPFCGQMPLYWQAKMYGGERAPSFIRCRRCNFYVSKMGPDSDEQVFDIWNTRPVEDALLARAERADLYRELILQIRNLYPDIEQLGLYQMLFGGAVANDLVSSLAAHEKGGEG